MVRIVKDDFNGDGISDVLWMDNYPYNVPHHVSEWFGAQTGPFVSGPGSLVASEWRVVATGDFNGDGISDVIWESSTITGTTPLGTLTEWLGKPGGGWTDNSSKFFGPGNGWSIIGAADFNHDGVTDLLVDGANQGENSVSVWLASPAHDGTFTPGWGSAVGPNWDKLATGDFNGDGYADILWGDTVSSPGSTILTEWLGQPGGGWVENKANFYGTLDSSWELMGKGDFNGDGMTDLLWEGDNPPGGSGIVVSEWLAAGNGTFTPGAGSALDHFLIPVTGDYNGDGRDDILWQNQSSNTLTEWLSQPGSGWVENPSAGGHLDLQQDWWAIDFL